MRLYSERWTLEPRQKSPREGQIVGVTREAAGGESPRGTLRNLVFPFETEGARGDQQPHENTQQQQQQQQHQQTNTHTALLRTDI